MNAVKLQMLLTQTFHSVKAPSSLSSLRCPSLAPRPQVSLSSSHLACHALLAPNHLDLGRWVAEDPLFSPALEAPPHFSAAAMMLVLPGRHAVEALSRRHHVGLLAGRSRTHLVAKMVEEDHDLVLATDRFGGG